MQVVVSHGGAVDLRLNHRAKHIQGRTRENCSVRQQVFDCVGGWVVFTLEEASSHRDTDVVDQTGGSELGGHQQSTVTSLGRGAQIDAPNLEVVDLDFRNSCQNSACGFQDCFRSPSRTVCTGDQSGGQRDQIGRAQV